MPKDARLAAIALEKFHVARPHQSIRRTFPRMLAVLQTGVNINRKFVLMIRRQVTKELDLFAGNFFSQPVAGRRKVGFEANSQWGLRVLHERLVASGGLFDP